MGEGQFGIPGVVWLLSYLVGAYWLGRLIRRSKNL